MINALIVDDEELARENLAMLLESYCPSIRVTGKAKNKEEAKAKIEALNPQVVFLDICMPSGIEGLTLLDEIPNPNFIVVFVTAFKEYAIKAFNANAVHYLLKPIDIEELIDAGKKIEKRLGHLKNNREQKEVYQETIKEVSEAIKTGVQDKLTITHSKGIKIINQKDIVYLQADNNCTILHFKDGTKYTDTRTLKTYENLLSDAIFFRTHKSFIINLNDLKELVTSDGSYALLTNGKEIPIARSKSKTFRSILKAL